MLDRIADMLDEVQIKYARLDGTMTREERSRRPMRFATTKRSKFYWFRPEQEVLASTSQRHAAVSSLNPY